MSANTKNNSQQYIETVGRRKTAVARVRLYRSNDQTPTYSINDRKLEDQFPTARLQRTVKQVMDQYQPESYFMVSVLVRGGGITAQAEAIRHGLARALVKYDESYRRTLRQTDLLKRDPRQKERKKFGLKKARKSPQWSKR